MLMTVLSAVVVAALCVELCVTLTRSDREM
jgi:hypothetical protein